MKGVTVIFICIFLVINVNCNNNKKGIDKKAALQCSVFSELAISQIKPQDWLKQDLVNQKKRVNRCS